MDPNGRLFSGLIPRDADFDARARSGTEGSLSVESDAEVAGLFEGGASSSIDRYMREFLKSKRFLQGFLRLSSCPHLSK